jgi:hypothetical protein
MSHEIPEPNPPLSPEEESVLTNLASADLEFIDATVLSCARPHWQKVAMVVGRAKQKLEAKYPEFSHSFYAMRVQVLADARRLESQGDLDYMRFSEVRLPNES